MGAGRKSAGKLARKKGYKQKLQRRTWEKKRKVSLLRRVSGKRTSTELAVSQLAVQPPHTQIMPRSVSSQEGMTITPGPQHTSGGPPTTVQHRYQRHRLSDAGLQGLSSTSSSAGSQNSSPASSGPQSPALSSLWQTRPSSLHGLKHKISQTFKSPGRRKQAQTMPLSPLARAENVPAQNSNSAATTTSGASGNDSGNGSGAPKNGGSATGATSPTRSPSPLAAGCVSGKAGVVKKTITKPKKSSDPGIGSTGEFLRVGTALSPRILTTESRSGSENKDKKS